MSLAAEHATIEMVTDEIGSPTYAGDVAQAIAQLIGQPAYGTYHLTNSGTCSRYEWTEEILRLNNCTGLNLVPTQDYARAARVPKHVELRNFCAAELGIVMRPWREALRDYLLTPSRVG